MILEGQRTLDCTNIDQLLSQYLENLKTMSATVSSETVYGLLTKLKREKISVGPYPTVTLFEAANRIMTDLTILYGIKSLLHRPLSQDLTFDSFTVEFGNENKNRHDIEANNSRFKLYGEAFNVAESFFQAKRYSALKKLRESESVDLTKVIILMYNDEAPKKPLELNPKPNEYNIPVKISF